MGQVKTKEECQALMITDVAEAEKAVRRLVKVKLTQEQFDQLVSFVFNVGEGNFQKSTLLRKLNSGQCWAAAAEFDKWVYAKGKKLPGLVTRRAYERREFETGCLK
jgi:lysozyme